MHSFVKTEEKPTHSEPKSDNRFAEFDMDSIVCWIS